MDVLAVCEAVLYSGWLLPLLVVMIAVDAPFPVLPSETLLMSASALAFGSQDVAWVAGIFVAALVGSVAGDLVTFGLGRSSQRVLAPPRASERGLTAWVRRHLLLRPGIALVGARFVPGGRLVSTGAAGRYGLSLHRFLPWTMVSSAAWSAYMLLIGLILGPLTGGSPFLSLVAGVVMAVLTAGAFALTRGIRGRRGAAASVSESEVLVPVA